MGTTVKVAGCAVQRTVVSPDDSQGNYQMCAVASGQFLSLHYQTRLIPIYWKHSLGRVVSHAPSIAVLLPSPIGATLRRVGRRMRLYSSRELSGIWPR